MAEPAAPTTRPPLAEVALLVVSVGLTVGGMAAYGFGLKGAADVLWLVTSAIGTIAAAAFGAILYTVVTGDNIVTALTGIIDRALSTSV